MARDFSINHGGIYALQAVLIFFFTFFTFSLAYGVMNKAFDGFASSLFRSAKTNTCGSVKKEAKREREREYKDWEG